MVQIYDIPSEMNPHLSSFNSPISSDRVNESHQVYRFGTGVNYDNLIGKHPRIVYKKQLTDVILYDSLLKFLPAENDKAIFHMPICLNVRNYPYSKLNTDQKYAKACQLGRNYSYTNYNSQVQDKLALDIENFYLDKDPENLKISLESDFVYAKF